MSKGTQEGTAAAVYRRCAAAHYTTWHKCGMERAVKQLAVEHEDVLYCQRWLLANVEPGPVKKYRVNFELLKYMMDTDAGPRKITPGAFQVALFLAGYSTLPGHDGEWVGVTRQSVRDLARRQSAAAGR